MPQKRKDVLKKRLRRRLKLPRLWKLSVPRWRPRRLSRNVPNKQEPRKWRK